MELRTSSEITKEYVIYVPKFIVATVDFPWDYPSLG